MAFRFAVVACAALLTLVTQLAISPAAAGSPLFETAVAPILADKCGQCHSDAVQKAGLDLSSASGLRRGGESGEPLLDEASAEDSLLWLVIEGGEMPPPGEPPLSEAERQTIRQWMESGFAFREPARNGDAPPDHHDVTPILLLRCNACHGPRRQQGGLDLRTRESMLAGGKRGPAMIPGDADASLMVQRIESHACPPGDQLLKFFVRRPSEAEVQTLRDWIDAGAPLSDRPPDAQGGQPDRLVTAEDRQHWAFRPPRVDTELNSIDQFIQRRLGEEGLQLSPPADRDTLIRRAHLDLIGMPPTLQQYEFWHRHEAADWYARMIDRLLASERYGERWGRYWLDLAGYADSEGGISADPLRPVAWKYRDYVIRSFNRDKPYDQFLIEQLAGDELVDHENAERITPAMVERLVATGFLRMGIDETGSRTMNFVPERLKVIDDAITVVSSSVMGLTMQCARCHSHKYDPIPHRDYYRLKAVFQGALDEHDWDSFKTRKLSVATAEHRRRMAEVNPPLESKIKRLEAELRNGNAQLRLELLRHHYPEQSADENQKTLKALKRADNNRTLEQKRLVERLVKADLKADAEQPTSVLELRQRLAATQRKIDLLRRKLVPPPTIRALWDRGRPSPTYILRGGEATKPGDPVGPGVPSVLTDGRTPFDVSKPFPGGTPKTGRRLAFAKWLTQPEHPLTARVLVNRVWYHHFGRGLVQTLENFGLQGGRPSHPELLDWLALRFVRKGWSIKHLHRLIMNSRTYRQSSRVSDEALRQDPENRLLSRMSLRRVDAEALRDSLLLVSGKLENTPGGIPDPVTVNRSGLVTANPTAGQGYRRSVYLQYRRTAMPTMMDTFDYPQMGPNCVRRPTSTVSPQALMLMNNGRVRQLAGEFARRVREELRSRGVGNTAEPAGADAVVELVYKMALSRRPTQRERELSTAALAEMRTGWDTDAAPAADRALETFCHTILNSAAFLFVD
jgi:mono/diheme cytochrome c family protein